MAYPCRKTELENPKSELTRNSSVFNIVKNIDSLKILNQHYYVYHNTKKLKKITTIQLKHKSKKSYMAKTVLSVVLNSKNSDVV